MSSDWDEIKRLAADFQKAQLTSTLQKLSERNCIEIITLLLEKNLVEVYFTNDGKEYITPQHLEREIQDELYLNGGRVNLVEVTKTLNMDLSRIEHVASRISAVNKNIRYMLGQLISDDYIAHIAQEINEKLALRGEISVSDLTQQYDLPSDFLQRHVMEKHLGKLIRGRQDATDSRLFYTQAYIQRCKARIRGALAALTRPINVSTILQQLNIQEKIFHSLLDEIAPAGQVTSKMANAQYVPHIYTKMQSDWVNSFFKQNGFIEYEAVNKLGISDAKQFLRKQFPNEGIIFLKGCAVGSKLIELTVLSSLTECHAAKSYVDLSTILPSNMSEEDIEELFNIIMTNQYPTPNDFVYMESIVFSQQYLKDLMRPCHEMAIAHAKTAIESGVYQKHLAEKQLSKGTVMAAVMLSFEEEVKFDKRDERRKKAAIGKAGGGSQGRETKTKSTKKHQRGGGRGANQNDSDDDDDVRGNASVSKQSKNVKPLELVKVSDIVKIIRKPLEEEGLEHLADTIARLNSSKLNQVAIAKAQELFEISPQADRRQNHSTTQEKINQLLVDIRLYEKGLKLFSPSVQAQLVKYLLKSLGNDVCNELTAYIAEECNLTLKVQNLNIDQRCKIAQECGPEYKTAILELNKFLNLSIDDFIMGTEAALKLCSMIIKKIDKKKDRQLILQHREKLIQQLNETEDAALALHLTALILFTTITGCILHASGKFVSQILAHIQPQLSPPQSELLMNYHDLVLKLLQNEGENKSEIEAELNAKLPEIKSLAAQFKNPGVSKLD